MPLSQQERDEFTQLYNKWSGRGYFTPKQRSFLAGLQASGDQEILDLLGEVRQARSQENERYSELERGRVENDDYNVTWRGILSGPLKSLYNSPPAQYARLGFQNATGPVADAFRLPEKAAGAAMAMSAGVDPAQGTAAFDEPLPLEILATMAGEKEPGKKVDITADARQFVSGNLDNVEKYISPELAGVGDAFAPPEVVDVAANILQGTAEVGMVLPGIGGAIEAGVETKAPPIIGIPRAFGRTLMEFAVAPGGGAVSAGTKTGKAAGMIDDALSLKSLPQQAAKAMDDYGRALLPATQQVANTMGQGAAPEEALLSGLFTLGGYRMGRGLAEAIPAKTWKAVAGAEGIAAAADIPLVFMANPDVAASILDGKDLTDEQAARLAYEFFGTGLGTMAGAGFGAYEVNARNQAEVQGRAKERVKELSERQRDRETNMLRTLPGDAMTMDRFMEQSKEAFGLNDEEAAATRALLEARAESEGVDPDYYVGSRFEEVRQAAPEDIDPADLFQATHRALHGEPFLPGSGAKALQVKENVKSDIVSVDGGVPFDTALLPKTTNGGFRAAIRAMARFADGGEENAEFKFGSAKREALSILRVSDSALLDEAHAIASESVILGSLPEDVNVYRVDEWMREAIELGISNERRASGSYQSDFSIKNMSNEELGRILKIGAREMPQSSPLSKYLNGHFDVLMNAERGREFRLVDEYITSDIKRSEVRGFETALEAVEFPEKNRSSAAGEFRSKAMSAIEQKMSGPMEAKSLHAMLKNAGVKEAELEWSGLADLDGKISPEDAKALFAMPLIETNVPEKSQAAYRYQGYDLVVPGAENYGEILIRLDTPEQVNGVEVSPYKTEHYPGFENILAHVRFDERTNGLGEKVTYLEEVQSDWAQRGRKKGFKPRVTEEAVASARKADSSWKNAKNASASFKDKLGIGHRDGLLGSSVYGDRFGVDISSGNRSERSGHLRDPEIRGRVADAIYNEVSAEVDHIVGALDADAAKEMIGNAFIDTPWLETPTRSRRSVIDFNEVDPSEITTGDLLVEEVYNRAIQRGVDPGSLSRRSRHESESILRNAGSGVPAMPYQSTDLWAGLAMRRMIQKAAQGGSNKLAWTSGDVQVDRFNSSLTSSVKSVGIEKNNDGTYDVYIERPESSAGLVPLEQSSSSASRVYEVFGKTLGDKLLAEADSRPGELRTVEGDGLRVGGDKMRNFYDKILPSVAKKIAKKYGAKYSVETIDKHTGPSHVIEINDKMRESALKEGMELFQREGQSKDGQPQGQAKGAVSFGDDGKAVIKAFEAGDVSTMAHELGHVFRRDMTEVDRDAADEWVGAKKGEKWTREQEEKWARGFERYLRDGKAPKGAGKGLVSAFKNFKDWLGRIYGKIKGTPIEQKIPPRMREVYDALLTPIDEMTIRAGADPEMVAGRRTAVRAINDLPISGSEMEDPMFPVDSAYPDEMQTLESISSMGLPDSASMEVPPDLIQPPPGELIPTDPRPGYRSLDESSTTTAGPESRVLSTRTNAWNARAPVGEERVEAPRQADILYQRGRAQLAQELEQFAMQRYPDTPEGMAARDQDLQRLSSIAEDAAAADVARGEKSWAEAIGAMQALNFAGRALPAGVRKYLANKWDVLYGGARSERAIQQERLQMAQDSRRTWSDTHMLEAVGLDPQTVTPDQMASMGGMTAGEFSDTMTSLVTVGVDTPTGRRTATVETVEAVLADGLGINDLIAESETLRMERLKKLIAGRKKKAGEALEEVFLNRDEERELLSDLEREAEDMLDPDLDWPVGGNRGTETTRINAKRRKIVETARDMDRQLREDLAKNEAKAREHEHTLLNTEYNDQRTNAVELMKARLMNAPDAMKRLIAERLEIQVVMEGMLAGGNGKIDIDSRGYADRRAATLERLEEMGINGLLANEWVEATERAQIRSRLRDQLEMLGTQGKERYAAKLAQTALVYNETSKTGLQLDMVELKEELAQAGDDADRLRIVLESLAVGMDRTGRTKTWRNRAADVSWRILSGLSSRWGGISSQGALLRAAQTGDVNARMGLAMLSEAQARSFRMTRSMQGSYWRSRGEGSYSEVEKAFIWDPDARYLEDYVSGLKTDAELEQALRDRGYEGRETPTLVKATRGMRIILENARPLLDKHGIQATKYDKDGNPITTGYFPKILNSDMKSTLRGKSKALAEQTADNIADAWLLENGLDPESKEGRAKREQVKAAMTGSLGDGPFDLTMSSLQLDLSGVDLTGTIKKEQASGSAKTRDVDLPSWVRQEGARGSLRDDVIPAETKPVLERDPDRIMEIYVRSVANTTGARSVFGWDANGAPTRMLPIYYGIEDQDAKKALEAAYRDTALGVMSRDQIIDRPEGRVWEAFIGMTKLSRALLLMRSHLSQPLSLPSMMVDAGLSNVVKGTLAKMPMVGRYFRTQMATAQQERIQGRAGMAAELAFYNQNGMDPMDSAQFKEWMKHQNGMRDMTGRLAMNHLQQMSGTPEDVLEHRAGRAMEAGAEWITEKIGLQRLNESINEIAAMSAEGQLNVLHKAILEGSPASRKDAIWDLENRFGITDVTRFIKTGPTDQDIFDTSRAIRARHNASDLLALERPPVMRHWATRLGFALQTITLVRGNLLGMEVLRMTNTGGGATGAKGTAARVAAQALGKLPAILGMLAVSGAYKEVVQWIWGQQQPTEDNVVNLGMSVATELGFAPGVLEDVAYAAKFGKSPTDVLLESATGGAATTIGTFNTGYEIVEGISRTAMSLGSLSPSEVGETGLQQFEDVLNTVPLFKSIGKGLETWDPRDWPGNSLDSLYGGVGRVGEGFKETARDAERDLDTAGVMELMGWFAEFNDLLSEGREAKDFYRRHGYTDQD